MNLTVERLGHRGDGVAPGPVYVPLSLPGEAVEGEVADGRMAAPRILAPSPDRVRPPCRHFPHCGGCALQHASDAFVATWKADVVRAALAAHDLPAPIRQVHTSPPGSRRRAVLSGRRTRKGALVGFHARASDTIVDVPDCRLIAAEIVSILPGLTEITVACASRKGELSLTVTATGTGADVAVQGAKPLDGPARAALSALVHRHGLARLTVDGEQVVQRVPPRLDFGGIVITPPPGAFLQATAAGEAALRDAVAEAVGPARHVADLFAGCGTFALPLACGAEVHAVESDPAALDALDRAWRNAAGLHRVSTEARDLFRRPLLASELARFDAAVIDPPRAGAAAQAAELARSRVPTVVAVSCDPASLARDAATLVEGGYRIASVVPVDQFRHSAHVEIVAVLRRP